ncbi:MAG: SMI1/KNR4 family protein [Clostridia bacterium]|nr:SMI1/KNR4 family protein [Clostridia bacterium]
MQKSIAEYEKLKNTERPLRLISEKDALKLLRLAKKERKEDFKKALPKAKSIDIEEISYAPVLPYYLIANGGYLSDEYEFLPIDMAIKENDLFAEELLAEELLETKPDGIVIAKCPDGDKVLLCKDGKVIRFSHEAPVATEEWGSLAQFVADAINE